MFLQPLAIESILSPCPGKQQAGSDLRLDRSRFRPLRNQYNVARTGFRQLLQQPDDSEKDQLLKTNQQNWETLSETLVEILTHETKDLELLSWLCECQMFSSTPWQCLDTALETLDRVLEFYWRDCHPGAVSEEDGRETPDIPRRLAILRTLFGEGGDSGLLVMPARLAQLIGETTLADCLAADRKGASLTLKSQLIPMLSTEAEGLKQQVLLLYGVRTTVQKLDHRLETSCEGQWAGGCLPLIELINTLIRWFDFICGDQINGWPGDPELQQIQHSQEQDEAALSETSDTVSATEPGVQDGKKDPAIEPVESWQSPLESTMGGAIQSRMEAYRQLQQLADYFRQAEPHSPVTCLLDRALSWGQMSLEDLMKELLSGHQGALDRVCDLTGLLTPVSRLPEALLVSGVRPAGNMLSPSSSSAWQEVAGSNGNGQQKPVIPSQAVKSKPDLSSLSDMANINGADQAGDTEDTQKTNTTSPGGFSQQLM